MADELPEQQQKPYYWGINANLEPFVAADLADLMNVCVTHQIVAQFPANNQFSFIHSLARPSLNDSFQDGDQFWQIVQITPLAEPIGDPAIAEKAADWIKAKDNEVAEALAAQQRNEQRERESFQAQLDRSRQQHADALERAKQRADEAKEREKKAAARQKAREKIEAHKNRAKSWGTLRDELQSLVAKANQQKPEAAGRALNTLLNEYAGVFAGYSSYQYQYDAHYRYIKLLRMQRSGFIEINQSRIRIDEVSEYLVVADRIILRMKNGNQHDLNKNDFGYLAELFS